MQIYIPLWFYSNRYKGEEIMSSSAIYIPLWFYSNLTSSLNFPVEVKFTFHYGSILIEEGLIVPSTIVSFTFHYGSILILTKSTTEVLSSSFTFHYGSILIKTIMVSIPYTAIYIPLWFYSNESCIDIILTNNKFTVHYGSILMLCSKNCYNNI